MRAEIMETVSGGFRWFKAPAWPDGDWRPSIPLSHMQNACMDSRIAGAMKLPFPKALRYELDFRRLLSPARRLFSPYVLHLQQPHSATFHPRWLSSCVPHLPRHFLPGPPCISSLTPLLPRLVSHSADRYGHATSSAQHTLATVDRATPRLDNDYGRPARIWERVLQGVVTLDQQGTVQARALSARAQVHPEKESEDLCQRSRVRRWRILLSHQQSLSSLMNERGFIGLCVMTWRMEGCVSTHSKAPGDATARGCPTCMSAFCLNPSTLRGGISKQGIFI